MIFTSLQSEAHFKSSSDDKSNELRYFPKIAAILRMQFLLSFKRRWLRSEDHRAVTMFAEDTYQPVVDDILVMWNFDGCVEHHKTFVVGKQTHVIPIL